MNKLALCLYLCCLIGSALAQSNPCKAQSMSVFGQYIQNEQLYYWNNCSTAAKAYYDQDLTVDANKLPSALTTCAGYTSSDIRKKCESDNNLSTLTATLQKFYQCYVDYQSKIQNTCTPANSCDSFADQCDYNHSKEATGSTSQIFAYAASKNDAYKNYITDLNLGLKSTQCTDINTDCGALSKGWQPICISVVQQKCLDSFSKKNYATDISYITYTCQLSASSFGLLAKLSFLALLAFFAF